MTCIVCPKQQRRNIVIELKYTVIPIVFECCKSKKKNFPTDHTEPFTNNIYKPNKSAHAEMSRLLY